MSGFEIGFIGWVGLVFFVTKAKVIVQVVKMPCRMFQWCLRLVGVGRVPSVLLTSLLMAMGQIGMMMERIGNGVQYFMHQTQGVLEGKYQDTGQNNIQRQVFPEIKLGCKPIVWVHFGITCQ
jgi:hypothetical protein